MSVSFALRVTDSYQWFYLFEFRLPKKLFVSAELLEKWASFGSAFFFVDDFIDDRQQTGKCLIAINKNGLRVMTLKDRKIVDEFALRQVKMAENFIS